MQCKSYNRQNGLQFIYQAENYILLSASILSPTICLLLQKEQLSLSGVGIAKFLSKYEDIGLIARTPGSGRPSRITAEIKALVEAKMQEDDETTALQLYALLLSQGYQATKSLRRPYFAVALH